jgi:hypothetical protein
MKKALIISGILIGVFFAAVFVMLVVDISNDVNYKVLEEEKHPKNSVLKS